MTLRGMVGSQPEKSEVVPATTRREASSPSLVTASFTVSQCLCLSAVETEIELAAHSSAFQITLCIGGHRPEGSPLKALARSGDGIWVSHPT